MLLALLSGALLPLAFAPFDLTPLLFLSLALQFWLWSCSRSHNHAFWLGWWFGLGLFGVGASWIQVSLHQFDGINLPLSLLLTLLFVAGMALFPALQGLLFSRLRAWLPFSPLGLLPLLWLLFEGLRSHLFGGFPWLLLGHTAPDAFYAGLAPWLGTLGLSLYLAILSLLLMLWIVTPAWRTLFPVLLLIGVGWGSGTQEWGSPAGPAMDVTLVQGNIPQVEKWKPENLQSTLTRYRSLSEQSDARLLIWPETAIPAFRLQLEDSFLRAMEQSLQAKGQTLLTGIPLVEWGPRRYYNGLLLLGEEQGHYHKRHLVPLGEYLPFAEWITPLLEWLHIPFSSFTPGAQEQPPLTIAGQRVGPTICYEIAYPSLAFSNLPEATMLVTISNDAWFGASLAPAQHLQIARMRALESGRPLLRATNTGITALVDHRGQIVQQLPDNWSGILNVSVVPREGLTPYIRWYTKLFLPSVKKVNEEN